MNLKRKVIRCLISAFQWLVAKAFKVTYMLTHGLKATPVTSVKDELLENPAKDLANMIRSREVKAVDVMEAFIARVHEVNPTVNAVCADRFSSALAEAHALDTLLMNHPEASDYSEEKKPFLGVPLSVKEAFAVTGMPNTSGLICRSHCIALGDADVVANVRQAGAIPFVVTNVSELCMWFESSNKVYGRTKNPYDTVRIVGGSSGGEGCLLGAGASVIGIGSDIGGSIRMPAFFNGVFGHRPSRDAVSNAGQFPPATGSQKDLLVTGPMCRYSVDLLPMLRVMAGDAVAAELHLDETVDLKKLNYFYLEDDCGGLLSSAMDPQIKATIRKVKNHFENKFGLEVSLALLEKLKYSLEIWSAKMSSGGGKKFHELLADETGSLVLFQEMLKWPFGYSAHTLPAIGLAALEKIIAKVESPADREKTFRICRQLQADIEKLLGNNGILFYPPHPKVAPYHNQPLFTPFDFTYTAIFNAFGLPVTQCPLGLSREGLPLGVQVVGPLNGDRLTIAVARELEAAFGGWTKQ